MWHSDSLLAAINLISASEASGNRFRSPARKSPRENSDSSKAFANRCAGVIRRSDSM
jgi:hypothetical protein